MESKKNDFKDGKARWDLLPWEAIEQIVNIYTFGAHKYAPDTWQHLPDGIKRYKAAMMRHLVEDEKGHLYDDESKLLHAAHMAWNAVAVLYLRMQEAKDNKENTKIRQHGRNNL